MLSLAGMHKVDHVEGDVALGFGVLESLFVLPVTLQLGHLQRVAHLRVALHTLRPDEPPSGPLIILLVLHLGEGRRPEGDQDLLQESQCFKPQLWE